MNSASAELISPFRKKKKTDIFQIFLVKITYFVVNQRIRDNDTIPVVLGRKNEVI